MSRVGREIAERAAVRTSKAARRERFKDFLGAERHGSAAVRPLIAGAPDEIGYGQEFELSVDARGHKRRAHPSEFAYAPDQIRSSDTSTWGSRAAAAAARSSSRHRPTAPWRRRGGTCSSLSMSTARRRSGNGFTSTRDRDARSGRAGSSDEVLRHASVANDEQGDSHGGAARLQRIRAGLGGSVPRAPEGDVRRSGSGGPLLRAAGAGPAKRFPGVRPGAQRRRALDERVQATSARAAEPPQAPRAARSDQHRRPDQSLLRLAVAVADLPHRLPPGGGHRNRMALHFHLAVRAFLLAGLRDPVALAVQDCLRLTLVRGGEEAASPPPAPLGGGAI